MKTKIIFTSIFTLFTLNHLFSQKANWSRDQNHKKEAVLDFNDFKLHINDCEIWNLLSSPNKDTIEIELGLSGRITDKKVLIEKSIYNPTIEAFQQYQTSFVVSDDGAHLDLLDWKHHTSEWKKIQYHSDILYTIGYTNKEKRLFPAFKKSELMREVLKEGAEKFNIRVKNLKFPIQTSDFVSISKITFKFICKIKNSVSTKILIVHLAMGC
jgi:hypothetical protein